MKIGRCFLSGICSDDVFIVKGVKVRPDPLPFRNDKRRDFCSRYDGYGDFCSGKDRIFFS